MEKALLYPFDGDLIMRKKRSLKKALLADGSTRLKKNIAVLGGSSTHDIVQILEVFLLNIGIEPTFYESEYGQYWEDAMFGDAELGEFGPDLIYIHTSLRNITSFPTVRSSREEVDALLEDTFGHFSVMWDTLRQKYDCPIIQNNFELPFYRLMGNSDCSDHRGRSNFVQRLNLKFEDYAAAHKAFYINDICYLSAAYGLEKWSDVLYWHMYKYALAVPAIPEFAYNLSRIIGSVYGANKKALVLDMDNTLWGGIVGDDGPENIEIGQETPRAQVYSEFQQYLKDVKDLGVMLTVASKNDEENALAGLNRPDSVLKPEDFIIIKANWDPKDLNVRDIAQQLNIGLDSLVFVDDNPAERAIVTGSIPGVIAPEITAPEDYIKVLDRGAYFEVTEFTDDDLKKNEMYKANFQRQAQAVKFVDYNEYLLSLEMEAEIAPFAPMYYSRISQLTNKSNQFNLTTKRCSLSDIESFAESGEYVTLYGRLQDKFGDNGVVTVLSGHKDGDDLHMELWLMSCRVLKRNMEQAMLDALVSRALSEGVKNIYGYYYPTAKNSMVKDFYPQMGFETLSRDEDGSAVFALRDIGTYKTKNTVIKVVNDND